MAPVEVSATCQVEVVAFDADNKKYMESFNVPVAQPLKSLQQKWAQLFRIPDTIVGFEDSKQNLVDVQSSPLELKWGNRVTLQAVPMDEQWAADEILEQDAAAKESAKPGAGKGATAVVAGSGRASSSGGNAAGAAGGGASANASAGAAKARAAGKKRPGPYPSPTAASASPAKNTSACPVDEDPIIFDQDNPKRPGTNAHMRYDKYKKAKTPKEAVRLGAERGDITNDFGKGFLRRR